MPRAGIANDIDSTMYNRFKFKRRKASLIRFAKHILYRAVLVLQADLGFVCVGVVGMHRVGVRVHLQQKSIRYHGPAEKQEQKQGDISQEELHFYT
ncbi:hypothetical protein GCM10027443_41400 [Pontibacter brevis]